jgi:transcriptional regulator with XRE-family HTH domain
MLRMVSQPNEMHTSSHWAQKWAQYNWLNAVGRRVRAFADRARDRLLLVFNRRLIRYASSSSHLSERGKKDPSLRVLKTIADGFRLTLSQFLRGL